MKQESCRRADANENLPLVGEFEQYGQGKRLGARAGVWSAGLKVGF